MRKLATVIVVVATMGLGAMAAQAEPARLKNPFQRLQESPAVRALPAAQLKNPFAAAESRAVRALPKAALKNPFTATGPDALPKAELKNPFSSS